MKYFIDNIRSIIGASVVLLSFTFLFCLLKVKIPVENKEILLTAAGVILAGMTGVTGYYFGSSKNESDKAKIDSQTILNSIQPSSGV